MMHSLVREQAANRALGQKIAGDAAEGPFPKPGMPVSAGDDQADILVLDERRLGNSN